jgi:membrane protease subunit HflC
MNGKPLVLGVIALLLLAALAASALYSVDERERALVIQFGQIVRSEDAPGLHLKKPLINSVRYFDGRVQTLETEPQLFLTREKKNLVVDSFVKWRIHDVARFFVTVGGLNTAARARLSQRVNDSLREEFGNRDVKDVISGDRAKIMDVVRKATDEVARDIGVEVVDVRLKRVDLVPEVSEQVYRRMEAERARVAKDFRARGAEEAEKIRADAERQREIIIAEAFRDAERLRGEGDSKATAIYAEAYGRDAEFYALYRSLNAYRDSFQSEKDILIVEPRSEFFKYFNKLK